MINFILKKLLCDTKCSDSIFLLKKCKKNTKHFYIYKYFY